MCIGVGNKTQELVNLYKSFLIKDETKKDLTSDEKGLLRNKVIDPKHEPDLIDFIAKNKDQIDVEKLKEIVLKDDHKTSGADLSLINMAKIGKTPINPKEITFTVEKAKVDAAKEYKTTSEYKYLARNIVDGFKESPRLKKVAKVTVEAAAGFVGHLLVEGGKKILNNIDSNDEVASGNAYKKVKQNPDDYSRAIDKASCVSESVKAVAKSKNIALVHEIPHSGAELNKELLAWVTNKPASQIGEIDVLGAKQQDLNKLVKGQAVVIAGLHVGVFSHLDKEGNIFVRDINDKEKINSFFMVPKDDETAKIFTM